MKIAPFLIAPLLIVVLTLCAICCDGGEKELLTPTPTSSACRADFFADPTEFDKPTLVRFTDQSAGEITSWAWDFNDNGTIDSTKQNPTYFYDGNGTFSVTLTVTGPGCEDTLTRPDYIHVSGCST